MKRTIRRRTRRTRRNRRNTRQRGGLSLNDFLPSSLTKYFGSKNVDPNSYDAVNKKDECVNGILTNSNYVGEELKRREDECKRKKPSSWKNFMSMFSGKPANPAGKPVYPVGRDKYRWSGLNANSPETGLNKPAVKSDFNYANFLQNSPSSVPLSGSGGRRRTRRK